MTSRSYLSIAASVLLALSTLPVLAQEPVVAIRVGRLIDGISPEPVANAVIIVEGSRIARVGVDVTPPPGARIIDLSSHTVLPGLIDTHTHVMFAPQDGKDPLLTKAIPYRTLEAAAAARASLDAGFTTLRDTDSEGAEFADVAVRDAIRAGLIPGPRLLVSTLALSITGGHMNNFGLSPEIDARLPQLSAMVDSTDAMIREVRRQVKYGADWIKLYATGSLRHIDRATLEPLAQFSEAQVQEVVTEAKRWKRDVAAHAYGGDGARAAVLGGVRSIEHGILLDQGTLKLMAQRGTFFVPTLSNFTPTQALAGYPEDFARRIIARHQDAFRTALREGVKIAFGTDAGRVKHGTNAGEFALMVGLGMPAMQAIQSATSVAAALLRMEGSIGAIKPGLQADIIAVAGDPLADVKVLQDVRFVMQGGRVAKSPPGVAAGPTVGR